MIYGDTKDLQKRGLDYIEERVWDSDDVTEERLNAITTLYNHKKTEEKKNEQRKIELGRRVAPN